MVDPLSGVFWLALAKTGDAIWSELVAGAMARANTGVRARLARWAGADKQDARNAAFAQAVAKARMLTLQEGDLPAAEAILRLLDRQPGQGAAELLAAESAKLLFLSDAPDMEHLTRVVDQALRFEAALAGETAPDAAAVAAVLARFLGHLRATLADQEPYQALIDKEILRTLREIHDKLPAAIYADEAIYRAQVARLHSALDFIGIPEIKDHPPITVEDIFIRLRVERLMPEPRELRELTDELPGMPLPPHLPVERGQEVTLTEALQGTSRLIVLGDPGSGKTTLLKYLAVICAEGRGQAELGLAAPDGSPLLPIFVSLREFAAEAATRNADYGLLDYFCTMAHERLEARLPRQFFEDALREGRCLVCLDGLDEVWAVGQRALVRDAVQALASRFGRSRYLVTSRIVGYSDAPLDRREFTQHTVLPLSDDDIREFVGKWYEQRERDPLLRRRQIDNLIATIEREERITTLARNPLLLTIITLVHRIEAELPNERVKLYDKCVGALVETWENVKGLTIEAKQRPFFQQRRRLLERLAYELHSRGAQAGEVRTIKRGDLELLLARFLMDNKRLSFSDDPDAARDEARAFIQLAQSRTGLLIERGDGEFGFPHLTFQEYLAACDLLNRSIIGGVDALWSAIQPRLLDPHWREVILLLLASLNKYEDVGSALVERILAAGEHDRFEPVLYRYLFLAAQALVDRVDVAADIQRRIVDELLDIVVADSGMSYGFDGYHIGLSGVADDALTALRLTRHDPYIATKLFAVVQDPTIVTIVRAAAASALREVGSVEQAIAGIRFVIGVVDLDEELKARLAVWLSKAGYKAEAEEFLAQSLRQYPQMLRRNAGLAAELAPFTPASQLVAVLKWLALEAETEYAIIYAAAGELKQLGYVEDAAQALLGILPSFHAEEMDRRNVAWLLQEWGYTEAAIEVLMEVVQDPNEPPDDRIDAAHALGELGQMAEITDVLSAIGHDREMDAWDRSDAAWAFYELELYEHAAAIWRQLVHEHADHLHALHGLLAVYEKRGQVATADQLLLHMSQAADVTAELRYQIAQLLLERGYTAEATPILCSLVSDPSLSAWDRKKVAQTLLSTDEAVAGVAMLLAQIYDSTLNLNIRIAAVRALEQVADQDVQQHIQGLLDDDSLAPQIRRAAAVTLAKRGDDKAAIHALLAIAHDAALALEDRYAAIRDIAQLGPHEAAAEMLLALATDSPDQRFGMHSFYDTFQRLVNGSFAIRR